MRLSTSSISAKALSRGQLLTARRWSIREVVVLVACSRQASLKASGQPSGSPRVDISTSPFMKDFFFQTSKARYVCNTGPHWLTLYSRSILPGSIESHRNCLARSGTFVYLRIEREPKFTGWMRLLGPRGYV